MNLLKVLSHTSLGADRTTLLKLYWSLVLSKLDYGCIIYSSARKLYLQMLDPIHNQGLRLALEGAQWLSDRVLDWRPKGHGLEPHRRHCNVVLEQDTFILAEYWFNPGRHVPI